MRALVAAGDWLTVFQLPPYASELNPLSVKRDIAQLKALAKTRLRRMQYRHNLIEGFLAGTRLDLTPSVTLQSVAAMPNVTLQAVPPVAHAANASAFMIAGDCECRKPAPPGQMPCGTTSVRSPNGAGEKVRFGRTCGDLRLMA
jgi:hypothetical protein